MKRLNVVALAVILALAALPCLGADGVWKFSQGDNPQWSSPTYNDSSWPIINQGDSLPSGATSWLRGKITIPSTIDGVATSGKAVALRLAAGSGAATYLNGNLYARCDSDHHAVILLTKSAVIGQQYTVAAKVWCDRSDEARFHWVKLEIVDSTRVNTPLKFTVSATAYTYAMPRPYSALSQPVDWPDYDPAFAQQIKDAGIKYVRMDHLMENIKLVGSSYDFTDCDKKLAYIKSMGAEPIVCLSYMPDWLRVRTDQDMRSAPYDFNKWKTLVYTMVKRYNTTLGYHIKYWEVWNEPNSPWWYYPADPRTDQGDIDSYCQLFKYASQGAKQADSTVYVGGPAMASGPWDNSSDRSYCIRGELFAKGLTQFCKANGVALDFVSWHEYFQPAQLHQDELDRWKYWVGQSNLTVKGGYMLTECNYAWWSDYAHSNELGAARMSNLFARFMVPNDIVAGCVFDARDTTTSWPNGDYGVITRDNKPKPIFNILKMWNRLGDKRFAVQTSDPTISVVSSKDSTTGRISAIATHWAEGGEVNVDVQLSFTNLPSIGWYRMYMVDASHSNLFNSSTNYNLEIVAQGAYAGTSLSKTQNMSNNSVMLMEIVPGKTLQQIRQGDDLAEVSVVKKTVTAVYNGMFYVEDDDRSNAVGVKWTGTAVHEGDLVSIVGHTETNSAGERFIVADSVQ